MKLLTELPAWRELVNHAYSMRSLSITELQESAVRNKTLNVATDNINIDFSNQCINLTTLELLIALAHERKLKTQIESLMFGENINTSENRPALHTALRSLNPRPIYVNHHDIIPDILATLEQIRDISNKIRNQAWYGYSGKPIKNIVNIGIGGSELGARFCINALSENRAKHLGYHFIANIDPHSFKNVVRDLHPDTTLFIISSKSFTTKETLYNLSNALNWLDYPSKINQHFIIITANIKAAHKQGFKQVLPIWDWVGGRYSFCSAINLITAIAVGYEAFAQILLGAHSMDTHFLHTDFHHNLPVLLGLCGIWNNNFLHINNLLMLIYAEKLKYFVPYLQQLDMESNGKNIDKAGRRVNYATGPIIWGGEGNQAQHSYYQLLCQGTHKIAIDCIIIENLASKLINSMAACKRSILVHGIHDPEQPNGYIQGNKPLNHIKLSDCTAFIIGQLIAMYEHKIYTQAVIWNINPFDQPGVESAKQHVRQSLVN